MSNVRTHGSAHANEVTTIAGVDVDAPRADGSSLKARFLGALSIASDGKNLFVADRGDAFEDQGSGLFGATIRQVVLSTLETTAMLGSDELFTTHPGVGRSAGLFDPAYMTFDAATRRLLIFDPSESVFLQVQ